MEQKELTHRYEKMIYRRVGKSGLVLPAISLGLWCNFGANDNYETAKEIIWEAFRNGVIHFDLANNYGPPPGEAEITFGKVLKEGLMAYRDELIISTKAGYKMWDGPYGDYGSRKYLFASLDQSLKRLGLPYVDIFYHHRPDDNTPLEETMLALRDIVLSGKALYVGLSNYPSSTLEKACKMLRELHVPFVIDQSPYSMLDRHLEDDHRKEVIEKLGIGLIGYSPLAQGRLSEKYIHGIPENSRAKKDYICFLSEKDIHPTLVETLIGLKKVAEKRGQTISQLALSYALNYCTSIVIGASSVAQLKENLQSLDHLSFSEDELQEIDSILKKGK